MVGIQTGCGVCASTGATARVATTTHSHRLRAMQFTKLSRLLLVKSDLEPSPADPVRASLAWPGASTLQRARCRASNSSGFLRRASRRSIPRYDLVISELKEDLPHLAVEFAYQYLDTDGSSAKSSRRMVRDRD